MSNPSATAKTNQQNANQQPPDKTQYFIIDHLTTPVLACRLNSRRGLFKVIAAGFQAARSFAGKLEHQEQFSHQNSVYRPQISNIEKIRSPAVNDELATAVGRTSPPPTADGRIRQQTSPTPRQSTAAAGRRMRRAAAIFLADAVTDHAPEGGAYNPASGCRTPP